MQERKFLSSIPETHIDALSKEGFSDKYPITGVIWKQNSLIDTLRFFPILKHGEVSVIRNYKVAADGQEQERKNVLIATLTPGAVFLEESHMGKSIGDPRGVCVYMRAVLCRSRRRQSALRPRLLTSPSPSP